MSPGSNISPLLLTRIFSSGETTLELYSSVMRPKTAFKTSSAVTIPSKLPCSSSTTAKVCFPF